jgi:putative FmdB family regulatory protein
MPTYRYRCEKDGEEFELWQSIHDDALTSHPGCGGAVTRVFAPAGIVLKGSGFYRTDSRATARKGSRDAGESKEKQPAQDGAGASGNGAGGDTKAAKESTSAKESGSNGSSSDSKGSKDTKPSKSGSSST